MSTVGPYHNRQETYTYYTLPFCAGPKKEISHYHETLGEALLGVELEFSGLGFEYKANIAKTVYCKIKLTEQKVRAFRYAVKNYYSNLMYMDDLPIWAMVGQFDEKTNEYYLFVHKKFEIGYNGNRIVDVNMVSEGRTKLDSSSADVEFSYEVIWHKSDTKFEDRFDKYLDTSFFQHRIHWFSIFNSFMMVIFLIGLVSMILMRTLRKDYARYSKDDDIEDMERDLVDEYGWKQVHGDVFRTPSYSMLFSVLIGTGSQIAVVALFVIVLTIVGELYTERGSILSTAIFIYAVVSPLNGFVGGSLYARNGGRKWIKQMFFSAFLLPLLICGTAFVINFVAIFYHASRAIPFGSMVRSACRTSHSLFSHFKKTYFEHAAFLVLRAGFGYMHLSVHHFAAHLTRHRARSQSDRSDEQSLSCERRASSDSGKEMVHGTKHDCHVGRNFTVWLHFHRNVFHLHLFLGLQNLLRVRLHAACILHFGNRDRLRYDRVHILLVERRRLQMVCIVNNTLAFLRLIGVILIFVFVILQAMDKLLGRRFDRRIRVLILILLFLLQVEDERLFPNSFLFRLHGDLLYGSRNSLWYAKVDIFVSRSTLVTLHVNFRH
jgi:hypothetical protein